MKNLKTLRNDVSRVHNISGYRDKFIGIFLVCFLLVGLTSCYLPKTLTQYDLAFENRKHHVSSYTEDCGFKPSDILISYVRTDGSIIKRKNQDYRKKLDHVRVKNDTLYLKQNQTDGSKLSGYYAIPIRELESIKVRRYRKGLTIASCIAGGFIILFLLS
jgi:hypothetical protein